MDKTTKRILELAEEGLSDSKIADRLKAEGFKNGKGGAFDRNSVRSRRLRAAQKLRTSVASDIPETSDIVNPLPEEWKSQIIQIVPGGDPSHNATSDIPEVST